MGSFLFSDIIHLYFPSISSITFHPILRIKGKDAEPSGNCYACSTRRNLQKIWWQKAGWTNAWSTEKWRMDTMQ